ncbi:MAG TPA: Maf family protein [Candidatus Angelobacter sp.]|nr:Maf family protein [Candidatus Angelobacter sp.]
MLSQHKLILASASPRRQDLLREAGVAFEVHPAHIPEVQCAGESPLEYALRLAREKAQAVAKRFPERFVLGADTIVVVDDQVLGKPRDAEDAARMLHLLSGRGHEVTTAVSLVLPQPAQAADTRSCTTQVFFRELRDHEIQAYATSSEPLDKAGAYAIQGGAARWNVRLEGDYSNVVGLPLPLLGDMLRDNGFM